MSGLYTVNDNGQLLLHLHPGQQRAWDSTRRVVAIVSGTQSGKTAVGPLLLWREIHRRGPGDYLAVTPTYPLLAMKALPEFLRLFQETLQLGTFKLSPLPCFTFSADGCRRTFGEVPEEPTKVIFGHASEPDSLESATAKAAWLDEAGQAKFKLGSWEAIRRRLAIHQGRIFIGTTPYCFNWLKTKIHDPWKAAGGEHPEIDVINFESRMNPAFPREEWERAKWDLPLWRFAMYYQGLFTRPAGLVYDAFDADKHKIPRFPVPAAWRRYLGLDFGGVNTAGVFIARDPATGKMYAYREYHAGGRTARGHAEELLRGEPHTPLCVGGSKSEGQWRAEFRQAGLPVMEPRVSEVEVGIDRVYGLFQRGELFVFDDLDGLLEELQTYAREVDEAGNPTEKIADKSEFHYCDSLRYISTYLSGASIIAAPSPTTAPAPPPTVAQPPAGVFAGGGNVLSRRW